MRCLRAALVALPLSLAPALAAAACKLLKIAELPVTMSGSGHKPLVTARINGADASFIADSGAFYSLITQAAAAQYGLKLHHAPAELLLVGIGGAVAPSATYIEELTLAGTPISHIEFIVGGSDFAGGAAGVLGQNVLGMADVEYDLANGVIRLMRPGKGCESAALAYWAGAGPYSVVDIEWPIGKSVEHTSGTAFLNGTKIRVLFDTGADSSMVLRRTAERLGFKPEGRGVVRSGFAYGIGKRTIETWIAPFASFKMGEEEIRNTRLQVGESDLSDVSGIDMLLGADFFLSHRVYVANSQDKLYFTYNGGPVFRLDITPSEQAAAHPSPGAEPTGKGEAGQPSDAAGFSRRGAAYAARRDFEHAIADLTRACELDPGEASYFRQRGSIHLSNGEESLAKSDFDRALRLKPGDVEALVSRAGLLVTGEDIAAASADLEAADRLVPKEASVRLEIADIYLSADQFARALAQYDLWIDAHAEDANLAAAKSGRCRARARLGADLNSALKDCNDAVKMIDKSASFLEGRGFVLFRLGEYDRSIADYDASLRLEPRNPWSLYGRGVARLRKGAAAEGEADIAAARAIWPPIADEARRHGIVP
jgi:tetratricopeptide (TPR) repeat protein